MAPTIAYWRIRGLAQPIRLLLGYTGAEFEDKMYDLGEAPEFSRDAWLSEKFTLGLAFPNLPYFIDGDLKLSQSNAILRHLGRKNKMDGETEEEKAKVDMLAEQVVDFRSGFTRLCYGPNFQENLSGYKTGVKTMLQLFDSFLGQKLWLVGDKLTYVDFPFWETLDIHLALDSTILEGFDNLTSYHKRFQEVPEIASFMASEKFFKGPINGPSAGFR